MVVFFVFFFWGGDFLKLFFFFLYIFICTFWLYAAVKLFYCYSAASSKFNWLWVWMICLLWWCMRLSPPCEARSDISTGPYFFFFFLLRGSIESNRMKLCLLTFQTAPGFWSMTSFTPCLDWTPSGLLNCQSHNHFYTYSRTKVFFFGFCFWGVEWGKGGGEILIQVCFKCWYIYFSSFLPAGHWQMAQPDLMSHRP